MPLAHEELNKQKVLDGKGIEYTWKYKTNMRT